MEEEEVDAAANTSYYAILNVPRDASQEDIKRSYRHVVQACHPDKVGDAAAREQAAQNFNRVQEAYEVLSNAERRTLYDVYGKQGLDSGLEVGEHLRAPDELKREYERFKAKQAEQRQEDSVAHRGMYVFKVDACDLLDPYDPAGAELASVATTNSVQIPLSDKTAASIGCQVAVRKRAGGGGSFVCGLKRLVTPSDTVELHAAIGLKAFVQLQVTRQLGEHTSATVAGSWQPGSGLGLAVSSSRQLSSNMEAEWSWQVGPESVMGLGLSRRGEKLFLSCRLETGNSLGIVAKVGWHVTATTSLRASAKLGTMGVELEVGGSQRVTEFSSAGCSVLAGIQGILLKPRFSRGGHVFEVPILLSQSPRDYQILAAAYVLPPLLAFAAKHCVVRPLRRRANARRVLERRLQHVRQLQASIREAQGAAKILGPLARRKLQKEVEKGGLVIVSAKYGLKSAIREAEEQLTSPLSEEKPAPPLANGDDGLRSSGDQDPRPEPSGLEGAESQSDEGEGMGAVEPPAAGDGDLDEEVPQAWLDVTDPVRFLVIDGSLQFHKGVPKSGLMGFCDVAVGEAKHLEIQYLWQGQAYSAVFGEQASGRLPNDGALLEKDGKEAARVLQLAEQQGLISGPASSGEGHDRAE